MRGGVWGDLLAGKVDEGIGNRSFPGRAGFGVIGSNFLRQTNEMTMLEGLEKSGQCWGSRRWRMH